MKIRTEIPDKVNPNCYVYKLGFRYPVCVYYKWHYLEACKILDNNPVFGNHVNESYYVTYEVPRLKVFYQKHFKSARWYAGQRLWRDRKTPVRDFWLVFQSEADRTMALMLLGS